MNTFTFAAALASFKGLAVLVVQRVMMTAVFDEDEQNRIGTLECIREALVRL